MSATSFKGYTPRNDFVLLQVQQPELVKGLAMPEISVEGTEFIVVAFGEKVENLTVGDKVHFIGKQGQDYMTVPREKGLIVTRETNVLLKYGHTKVKES